MPRRQGRIVGLVVVGRGLHQRLQGRDAFRRHRVALRIGVGEGGGEQLLVGEPLEGAQHAGAGLLGLVEIADGGAVGGRLLLALVGEDAAPPDLRPGADGGRPGRSAAAGDGRGSAADHGDRGEDLRLTHRLAKADEVAAGEVAGLVGDDADEFARRLALHDDAGVDEDVAAVGDEGVEGAVVDDLDLDAGLLEAGGPEDRAGVVADQRLGLGITDERDARSLRRRGHDGAEGHGAGGDEADERAEDRRHHASPGAGQRAAGLIGGCRRTVRRRAEPSWILRPDGISQAPFQGATMRRGKGMRISKRGAVAPFLAMDVLSAANRLEQSGRSIVHMELGEPGAPPPRVVREAADRRAPGRTGRLHGGAGPAGPARADRAALRRALRRRRAGLDASR